MDEIQSPVPATVNEPGLLDLLVTLAENARLLIIGPLFMGICALGLGFVLPPTYQSVAVLQAEQATASLMTTAAVLDPVAAGLGMDKDDSVEEARRTLRENLKVAVGRNDKLLTLTVSAPTPQQAQATANALLQQTYLQSRPKGSVGKRLQGQLAEAQGRLKNAESAAAGMLKRLETSVVSAPGGSELARGYADLLTAAAAAQGQVSALETQLEGLNEALLVQAPTLPQKASQPKKALMVIGATLGTGLLLLLFIFVRQALRTTATDANAASKLARIRRALGLKNQAA
ncbi:Wzz/FepE/Etk N-terminal domain-containing protein [Polaromonas sp.]|uniref:Wzz/FepE/Etk N-terminal domain-containing protein n=1 Tax=Polaromonas sp. TaxID=1869339 RepID=UPI001DE5636D|nr:Wzz/FepE/Etk N-terminal domain-containing protein [Polaromonas sp.]MBT9477232.1 lipopolysaccharide biosynthesis protein [Polaromonas sp.]